MDALTRTLKLNRADTVEDVTVSVFWPSKLTSSWECAWQIAWPDRVTTRSAYGEDALQALELAMKMIGTTLYCSDEHRDGQLTWLENGRGYGFPVPNNIRDMLVGEDAKFF